MMSISYYIIIVAYLKGKRRQKREGRSYLSEKAVMGFPISEALDLRIYTSRDNFDVPAHAVQHLIKDFTKTFRRPLRIQWFPGSSSRNELAEEAVKLDFKPNE